jgi:DNA-binding CsgD family transcriptional regulator
MLYNGTGRFEDAYRAATAAATTPHEVFASVWALPELVEAAVRTGATDEARAAAERLSATTQPARTAFGLGIDARCQALVSVGDAADASYRAAIGHLTGTRMRADLARTRLLYGEWLRATGQRAAAQNQLRTAHAMLAGMGLAGFAERARLELVATGEKVSSRTAEAPELLTPQERQIAQLARDGLSNQEIGARLFLSPRTVEWHLGKIFAKLGIRSRRSLSVALAGIATYDPDVPAEP